MKIKKHINPKQSRRRRFNKSSTIKMQESRIKRNKNISSIEKMYPKKSIKHSVQCPEGYTQCHRGKSNTLQCCPNNQ
jgi:hypothetical protein